MGKDHMGVVQDGTKVVLQLKTTSILMNDVLKIVQTGNHYCGCIIYISHGRMQVTTSCTHVVIALQNQDHSDLLWILQNRIHPSFQRSSLCS